MNTASFWQKNKVLITSILSAIAVFLEPVVNSTGPIDWKFLGLGALAIVAGIVGNELRGKSISMGGVIGAIAIAYVQVNRDGELSWDRFILSVVVGVLAIATPAGKSIGYEKTDIIKQAKKEGEVDVPTPLAPKPDKVVN